MNDETPSNSVDVINFGCRLNAYESEAMKRQAMAAGHTDMVIFNTCAVTAEAVRQAKQSIRKIKRANPKAQIVVTGCAAQVEENTFSSLPEVNQIIGNDIKLQAKTWVDLSPNTQRVQVGDIMQISKTHAPVLDGFEGKARAFVQIQNGCDHRCTFCIIPYGRGPSRSVPIEQVLTQIQTLVERGYKEIVLTGVDLTSYGADLEGLPKLGDLTRAILKHVPHLPRLRISSIDAVEVDDALYRAIAEEERLMPHLHLSLQAGDTLTLKRMKRRHSRQDAIDFCHQIKKMRPDMVFGADLIAGFPTETEEMFANSLSIVDECDLTFLHVFPYSARPQTPAARMPQLNGNLIKERAKRLREKGDEALKRHLIKTVGHQANILVEGATMARTQQYTPVRLLTPKPIGTILTLPIKDQDGRFLIAD